MQGTKVKAVMENAAAINTEYGLSFLIIITPSLQSR
jgi:hypothetical protein